MKYIIANRRRLELFQSFLESEDTVKEASQESQDNQDLILAAHFFDHEGDQLAHSMTGLLRSLLFQLLQARPQLFEAILPRYKEMKRFHTALTWSYQDLKVAFEAMLSHSKCGPVIFFIDALDEADEMYHKISDLIVHFSKVCSKNTQFCVSSRPLSDFRYYFDPEWQIGVDEYSAQDIHQFVRESFQEVASRFNTDYGLLIEQIALRAENVFLWARLVVEDLLRAARRRESVKKLLHRLLKIPTRLGSFYRRMIDQVVDYERSEVLQILGLVFSAMEPLSIEQLQDVMEHCSNQDATQDVRPGAQQNFHSTLDLAEHFEERIQSICFGLIEVRTTYYRKETRREVAFSHHTVNDFLETLDVESETQGHPKLTTQGNFDLLRGCVDCMVAVNTSDFIRVISLDEQLRRQSLAGNDTTLASNIEWARLESQSSWIEAELDVRVFAICPFLRYAASHWAQHARATENRGNKLEIGTSSYHSILSKLTPINFRLWSLLMRRADDSWSGIKGRQFVTPSTLLEYAAVFGLAEFVEEELHSPSTNKSKEHQFSDPTKIYRRLLYAAATGGNFKIAKALMAWGAKFDTSLHCMANALSRAIFRGNQSVLSLFGEHGALLNVPGVYLEGFSIQSQYRTPDILALRITDRPLQLEATPVALLASLGDTFHTAPNLFRNFADFDPTITPLAVDPIAQLTKWDPQIAIDDFAVDYNRHERYDRTDFFIAMQMHKTGGLIYVKDEATNSIEESGGSTRPYVPTVKLPSIHDLEGSWVMLKEHEAAYGLLPKLDITAAYLMLSPPPYLTKRLLNLGYSYVGYEGLQACTSRRLSMERPLPFRFADS